MTISRSVSIGLLCSIALFTDRVSGQVNSSKPLISKEIRTVFEKSGAEAAQKRYQEIAGGNVEAWEFDINGVMDVGTEYMKAGDLAAAQVFMGIATEMGMLQAQAMQNAQQSDPEFRRIQALADSADRAERERVEAMPAERRTVRGSRGDARSDLARFAGVYGDPEKQRIPRNYFIQACGGFLRFGAMWGDVAPYGMRSTGDLTFEQAWLGVGESTRVELRFHVNPAGKATAITHTFTFGNGPQRIPLLEPLPGEWADKC